MFMKKLKKNKILKLALYVYQYLLNQFNLTVYIN